MAEKKETKVKDSKVNGSNNGAKDPGRSAKAEKYEHRT